MIGQFPYTVQHKIILQNLFIFPSSFSWDNHLRVANNKSTVAYLCLLSANTFAKRQLYMPLFFLIQT